MKRFAKGFLIAAALGALGVARGDDKPQELSKLAEISLEGDGGFDYVSVDAAGERVYVAHGAKIDVIDAAKNEKVGSVDGVDGSHGAIAVLDAKKGFATAGRKAKLVVFDLETFETKKEVATGEGCDALLHVTQAKEVWTFNGRAKSVTCVSVESLEVKATIKLEGKPEGAVEDVERGLVYVNLEDKSSICVLDVKKHEVAGTHPLAPAEEPTGLAFDAKNGQLLAGCGNKKLAVVDVKEWKVVATPEIGGHCDGVAFDPGTECVFASCRQGGSTALHRTGATTFAALPALADAKTCCLDPKSHKLYLVTGPKRGEKGAVKVLVYGPKAAAPSKKESD